MGRRNLTKQDRAYLIGSLEESKSKIAKELEIGTTQIATTRKYYKAVNWLVKEENKDKDKLLKSTISSVISSYKKITNQQPCTENVQVRKKITWNLNSNLVIRLKKFSSESGEKSVPETVEKIIKEYLNEHEK